MNYLYQRVSYLKGLAEGLNISESTDEGKVLLCMIEVLEDFADTMNGIVEDYEELEDFVSFIDEDLTDVEEELYGVSDEELEDFDEIDYDDFEDYDEFFDEDDEDEDDSTEDE